MAPCNKPKCTVVVKCMKMLKVQIFLRGMGKEPGKRTLVIFFKKSILIRKMYTNYYLLLPSLQLQFNKTAIFSSKIEKEELKSNKNNCFTVAVHL